MLPCCRQPAAGSRQHDLRRQRLLHRPLTVQLGVSWVRTIHRYAPMRPLPDGKRGTAGGGACQRGFIMRDPRFGIPQWPPTTVGPYTLEGRLGHGGLGVVYRARHQITGATVAIKFLHREWTANWELAQMFRTEARMLALLSHPNIVRVLDSGAIDHGLYIVMEYIPGETLRQRLQMTPAPWSCERVLALGLQLTDALAYARMVANILHRDIKPENIVLTAPDDRIKLLDFGLAMFATRHTANGAGTVRHVGTPAYMAPELLSGLPATPQSDVYGVAVVLYELLYGATGATASRPLSTARVVAQRAPETVLLQPVLARALAHDPAARFTDVHDLHQALRHVSDRLRVADYR